MFFKISNRQYEQLDYCASPEELDKFLEEKEKIYGYIGPEYNKLLFVFWSWKVPKRILDRYDCYGCHTGPLLEGKGKGGSPIRNLKKLGVKVSTLCVFNMTEEIDGGPVKLAMPLYLDDTEGHIISGRAQGICDYLEEWERTKDRIPVVFKRLPENEYDRPTVD